MLARSSKLIHPLGSQLETPLLISSFSSKGFRFLTPKDKPPISEVAEFIRLTSELLYETALVSAFDLNYYLGSNKGIEKYRLKPDMLFIDSGGFETIEDYDLDEIYKFPIKSREWTSSMHEEQLEKMNIYPLVIVSYDNGQEKKKVPIKKQCENARRLFNKFPKQLNDFLIKPSKKNESHLNIDEVLDNLSLIKTFNIIGMTEKELGNSTAERLKNLKTIRIALDNVGCSSPIHLFGNLDPLTSILYFLNGAEIFDGLTWLRYGFYEGLAISKSNRDLLDGRINEKDAFNSNMTIFQNIIYLRNLTQEMKTFLNKYKEGKEDEAYKSFTFVGERVKHMLNNSK